jgi:hypothetical protein
MVICGKSYGILRSGLRNSDSATRCITGRTVEVIEPSIGKTSGNGSIWQKQLPYNESLQLTPKMQSGSWEGRLRGFFGSDAAGQLNSMLSTPKVSAPTQWC